MSEKYFYLPRARLYHDKPRDRKILEWLEGLPSGFKGDGIKDAIWASIRGIEPVAARPPKRFTENPPHKYQTNPPPNGTMNGSLTLDTRELLADIRRVIEVSVAQGLAQHGYVFGQAAAPEQKDEVEVEALLNDLDMSFMLDDDDDDDEEE